MRYQKIHSQIWTDEKFIRLSNHAKLLFIYILSCPHSNAIGLFVLPKQYIECDLGWTSKQLQEPFQELLQKGLIEYNNFNRLVFIKNQLKHNPLENENQSKAAAKIISSLPKEKSFYSAILKQLNKRFHKPFRELLEEQLHEQYAKPEEETETETGTETETEIPCGSSPTHGAEKNGNIPYQEIRKAFNEILPDLPNFRDLTETRRKAIKSRWNTDEKTKTLEWWTDQFFPLIAESDFLTGRNGKWTSCNIDWILKASNFQKIREGTYNR